MHYVGHHRLADYSMRKIATLLPSMARTVNFIPCRLPCWYAIPYELGLRGSADRSSGSCFRRGERTAHQHDSRDASVRGALAARDGGGMGVAPGTRHGEQAAEDSEDIGGRGLMMRGGMEVIKPDWLYGCPAVDLRWLTTKVSGETGCGYTCPLTRTQGVFSSPSPGASRAPSIARTCDR